jgi:hypothetical protein
MIMILTVLLLILAVIILYFLYQKKCERLSQKFIDKNIIDINNNFINLLQPNCINYIDKKLINKFNNKNSKILLIGNGPINFKNSLVNKINQYDIVIRFNYWEKDTDINKLGERCDLCMINYPAFKIIKNYNKLFLFCECDQKSIKNLNEILNIKSDILMLKSNILNKLCNFDPSRGMFMILLLYNYYNNITIIGFGGKGHHNNINNPMGHYQELENKYIKNNLKKIKFLKL